MENKSERKPTNLENLNTWARKSVTLKLLTIGFLMLILLIPVAYIGSLIEEREMARENAVAEVSDSWAQSQTLLGPILSVPIYKVVTEEGKERIVTEYAHFLPNDLQINGQMIPQTLKRGIYEIAVYKAILQVSGKFDELKNLSENLNGYQSDWQNAFLTIGLSDLRGIKELKGLMWNGELLPLEPGSKLGYPVQSGVTVKLPKNLAELLQNEHPFNFDLLLNGSSSLSFVPVGKTSTVALQSSWKDPSFYGSFLPTHREMNDNGFKADWKVLQVNRNFPQHWVGSNMLDNLSNTNFGVKLYLPIDDYQKATRSVKYALLPISLTFLVFFLVEIMNGKRIHPFQYTLVGLALCLFYILLISISEHSTFDTAYLISSLTIIVMISLYSISAFKKAKLSILLGLIGSATYGFLFITLQLTDYALLMGSIGLTFVLGLTMYFTRGINWYAIKRSA